MEHRTASRLAQLCRAVRPRAASKSIAAAIAVCLTALIPRSQAYELYSADGWTVQLDTTLRYTAGLRLTAPNRYLLRNPNTDDGDRAFAAGQLFSNRFDFNSILDVTWDDFGIQASADGWYDTVYHMRTANNSPATFNAVSVPNTQFPRATRDLEGQYFELGDAFGYANFAVARMPVSVRLGRQTVLWGESLFFDENSIAAAQAPIDYLRNTNPGDYSRNVFLPLNQLFLSVQPLSNLTIAAYYQFEWRASRLPAAGSYFSAVDILGAGSERLLLNSGGYLLHSSDAKPDGAHYGVSVNTNIDELDAGFYALRYASQYPYLRYSFYGGPAASGDAGQFFSTYPDGIDLYGASLSGYLANSSVAAEAAMRVNTPVLGGSGNHPYDYLQNTSGTANYARANTLHGQVSALSTLGPNSLWDRANINAEIGSTWLIKVTRNPNALDLSDEKFVSSVRAVFEPYYFTVLPGLDLSLPLGAGYGITGRSSLYFGPVAGAGDVEIGITGTYRSVWQARLQLTEYLGPASRQVYGDRSFVLFTIERTF